MIENDVWIGSGAVICDDVPVGQGSAVAAEVEATKDVAPQSAVADVLARRVREAGGQHVDDAGQVYFPQLRAAQDRADETR